MLNRLRWASEDDEAGVYLVVVHREGSAVLERTVALASVRSIGAIGIMLADDTFLPYHRVVAVRRGQATLWRARERRRHGGS
jgi:uncharacterized protein (UPF0248 family)